MPKSFEKVILYLACATFFVPLIVSSQYFIFPFIVPKVLLFRSLVLLMLFFYLLLLYKNREAYAPRFTFMNIAILFFLGSFAISTFTGADWYRSFWDNHERMLGLFTLLHYVVYYFILSSVYKGTKEWQTFTRVFLFAGSLVMLVGLWQKLVNPNALLNSGADRVASTLGNSIYVSSYGLFLVALGAIAFFEEKTKPYKWAAIAAALLGFAGILMGGSRGSLLGFCAMLVVFLFVIMFLSKESVVRKRIAVSFAVLAVIAGAVFLFRDTALVKGLPAVGRLVDTSFSLNANVPRVMAWGVAYDAWKEYPVFGWGPNNFFYAFNKYYRPQFLQHGWGETWFDNAHNIVMNTLAVQGVVGLFSYLAVFVVAFVVLWRSYKKEQIQAPIFAALTAFLVAHFVNNLFVFENPTSYLYFFFLLAYINSKDSGSIVRVSQKNRNIPVAYIGAAAVIVLVILFKTNINTAKANNYTLTAIRMLHAPNQPAVETLEKALNQGSPHIDDIRSDFAKASYPVMVNYYNKGKQDAAKQLFSVNYTELKKNLALHPLDIRPHMLLTEQLTVQAQIQKNISYLYEAEKLIEDASKESPKRQQYKFLLSNIKLQIGKHDEAIALAREAVQDDETIWMSWYQLLTIYDALQKKDEAEALIEEARSKGVEIPPEHIKTIRILQ